MDVLFGGGCIEGSVELVIVWPTLADGSLEEIY